MSSQDHTADTMTSPAGSSSRGRAEPGQLRIVYPRDLATTVALPQGTLVLGRRPTAERSARLAHPTVSRQHFAIEWDEASGRPTGRDLGSHNGSSVAGRVLGEEPVALEDNAVVRMGDVLAVVERDTAADVDEPAQVSLQAIPGRAAATRRLRSMVGRAGPDPSPVLLVGETGTGKEFIARELCRLGQRPGPFVAVNCAALSPQLIESQLFGHARGAFTGAQAAQPGLFRAAHEGCLLLDEVGELPTPLQPKLLRVLQEREVLGVGETRPVSVDVRVIAATLKDLPAQTRTGRFRLDLYARLSLWELRVPPLRERRADLFGWLERLAQRWFAERTTAVSPLAELEAAAAELLLLHDWPDNLRGVDRLVHRWCSEASQGAISEDQVRGWLGSSPSAGPADEPPGPDGAPPKPALGPDRADDPASAGASAERLPKPTQAELEQVLAAHDGSVRATAKHFGRDRRQIYRWLEQYGLRSKVPGKD